VLLPRHVCGHVEHKRSKPDHCVRRDVRRPGRLNREARSAKAAEEARITHPEPDVPTPGCKPNIGKVGSAPPPASRDRLQRLAQIGVIIIGDDAERHAIIHPPLPVAPPKKSQRDASPGSTAQAAAHKYIAERELTRARGLPIPKHVAFSSVTSDSLEYAGTRHMEGQALALLRQGSEIIVLPIDLVTAKRLKRVPVGQAIVLSAKGTIKTKGWSR
jgi:hypothetical protein